MPHYTYYDDITFFVLGITYWMDELSKYATLSTSFSFLSTRFAASACKQ